MSKYILKGLFHQPHRHTYNGRIYDADMFKKFLDDYKKKELYNRRKRIINKLLNKSDESK